MITRTLYRYYHHNFTAGVIPFDGQMIYTVERPWVQDDPEEHRAGKPFESCIPEGLYELERFTRSNGDNVWSLCNEDLGVFVQKDHMLYDTDRYACLIHVANKVNEVVGCIGPGLGALNRSGDYATQHSREAMAALEYLLADCTHLEIISYESLKTENAF